MTETRPTDSQPTLSTREELRTVKAQAQTLLASERARRQAAETQTAHMAEQLIELAKRPPVIIQPPEVSELASKLLEGLAAVLNPQIPLAPPQEQAERLSMDSLGLGARGDLPDDIGNFVPPWEDMPSHGGWIGAATGANGTPRGNTTPPHPGGMTE